MWLHYLSVTFLNEELCVGKFKYGHPVEYNIFVILETLGNRLLPVRSCYMVLIVGGLEGIYKSNTLVVDSQAQVGERRTSRDCGVVIWHCILNTSFRLRKKPCV